MTSELDDRHAGLKRCASSHNDQWKKKAAESGLELMDTALDNLASVWPIVDLFRSEIRSCRELMGTLPHGID